MAIEYICCYDIDQGETPLHVACRRGLVNLVHALLEAGSNANIQTIQPVDEDHSVTKQTPLHIAVEAGHKDIVKVFLDFKGVSMSCILYIYFTLAFNTSVLLVWHEKWQFPKVSLANIGYS